MPDPTEKERDWIDIGLKASTPVIVGIVIAWIGLFGDEKLTAISSQQESARLITELQIKREQAESELRKDIFAQALEAFLLKGKSTEGKAGKLSLGEMSKQLLRLELLALNFGDSLSLSPLFAEMRKDLTRAKPLEDEKRDFPERRAELLKRLNSLAKRVASTQLSSLEKHGASKQIEIPLYEYKAMAKEGVSCRTILLEDSEFKWPDDDILGQFFGLDATFKPDGKIDNLDQEGLSYYRESLETSSLIEFDEIQRYLEVFVKDVDHCRKTATVEIIVKRKDQEKAEAKQSFRLDYFNFPVVDNTRLQDNHRFAVVAENFDLNALEPRIYISAVIFPSEYASLRDRPGMAEARKLLESAMRDKDDDED